MSFECRQTLFEPMMLIAMLKRAGPYAEFFHVIAKDSHAVGMHGCRFAQVLNHVLDFAERHQVPQRFLSRKQPNGFAAVFRLIRSEEFGRLESRRKKMK